ncbi:cathepsin-like cysteine proteinase [Helicoverpa assulta nucleopolyhedrovirus]|uniref:Viral cathepsin n=1 Tax=Helicoverpa armigera nucleopolyhedrovirus TaxID=51313 RepID=A0A482EQV5_9ABAC|nr:cathepsin-like cysteine proteinase [Helicoverpa armigera NPV strain Australia]AXR98044.1 cathepsin-like cysteine proteinase [Helicoverpa assulta nucleopolyhedrovirus]QBM79028.1 cathepsin [Helicoverpa armigera nucleopolyhedrovirus]
MRKYHSNIMHKIITFVSLLWTFVVCDEISLHTSSSPVPLSSPVPVLYYNLDQSEIYFKHFLQQYNKSYDDPKEYQYRYNVFKDNLNKINSQNRENLLNNKNNNDSLSTSAQFGVNKFSDKTPDEVLHSNTGFFLNLSQHYTLCENRIVKGAPNIRLPDYYDWRDTNKVTPIKDQGVCGSCWAFVAIGNIESQYAIRHNKLIDLSEQQLLDCDEVDLGCNGGLMHLAFQELLLMGGVETEADYPYQGSEQMCTLDNRKIAVKLNSCFKYDIRDENKLKELVYTTGPVAIAVDAMDIINYRRGILNQCHIYDLNHAVLLIGWGIENNVPYWIIKNSWGEDWGENGYLRVRRNVNACGLLNEFGASSVIQ